MSCPKCGGLCVREVVEQMETVDLDAILAYAQANKGGRGKQLMTKSSHELGAWRGTKYLVQAKCINCGRREDVR